MIGPAGNAAILLAIAAAIALIVIASRRKVTVIYPPTVGLLYRNGVVQRALPPGRYTRFDLFGETKVVTVAMTELPASLGEATVLSKDQFSFRLGLTPVLRIVDPRLFLESQAALEGHALAQYMPMAASHPALHSLLAAAALEVVGGHTLAEVLADQAAVADAVQVRLADALPGASIERVLLTSVNLPPETRKMFTEVERAKLEGQAALERARGEQASLRVLANAARLVSDNPALANLRLLQAIESSKGATTIVVGNPAAAATALAPELQQSPSR